MRAHTHTHTHTHTRTQDLGINMSHIESRPSKSSPGAEYDFYVDCHCPKEKRDALMKKLRECSRAVNVLSRSPQKDEGTLHNSASLLQTS